LSKVCSSLTGTAGSWENLASLAPPANEGRHDTPHTCKLPMAGSAHERIQAVVVSAHTGVARDGDRGTRFGCGGLVLLEHCLARQILPLRVARSEGIKKPLIPRAGLPVRFPRDRRAFPHQITTGVVSS